MRIQAQNFTLTPDGAPLPSCPGCFRESSGDLHEHDCDSLGARFVSALSACPICLEHLDGGPTFPSPAAQYLRKTSAAYKLYLGFDYAAGLFLPADNGEFVLVRGSSKNSKPFVLPRATSFASKRDFYECYQDYYHCTNVKAGELHIVEPAFVERVGEGWKLQSMGVLEIVNARAEPDVPANNSPSETGSTVSERSPIFRASLIEESPAIKPPLSTPIEKSRAVTCAQCGSLLENRCAFCWNCGHTTKADAAASKPVAETRTFAPRIFAVEDESTIQQTASAVQTPMFSWSESQPAGTSPPSSLVKLIAIGVVGFVLVTLGVVLLKGSAVQLGHPAEVQVASSLQANADKVPQLESTTVATDDASAQTHPMTSSAERELWKLREKLGASPSDRSLVLQLLASAEEKFPDDYRFPYERAKLVINAREKRSHHDAFDALSLAAEKAIEANKAAEMLKALDADSVGDFHKLSRGHHEWTQIIEALERKDVTLVTEKSDLR